MHFTQNDLRLRCFYSNSDYRSLKVILYDVILLAIPAIAKADWPTFSLWLETQKVGVNSSLGYQS